MSATDPVMAVLDRLPLVGSAPARGGTTRPDHAEPVPFGLRFAVSPLVPCDKHKKTYYTVTVKQATKVHEDGTVITIQDEVEEERED